MLIQILLHTPAWVYALFVALAAYGSWQLHSRRMALARVLGVGIGMAGLGVFGVVSVFGSSPLALLASALAAVASLTAVLRLPLPAGTRYDAAERKVDVPGSIVPLLLMLGIFFTKFGVGVWLAFHPQMRTEAMFATAVCATYGAFSGIFIGRALRLMQLARRAQINEVKASGSAPCAT